MGQAESFVEADESQTDTEEHHPKPNRLRLIAPGSSLERRRVNRPVHYSSSSNESALETLLQQRRTSLHRKSSNNFAHNNGFKYPHPLYATSRSPPPPPASSVSHNRRLRNADSPPEVHKSESSQSAAIQVKNSRTTTTRLNDAVQKQLLTKGNEPLEFKYSHGPTSNCLVTATSYNVENGQNESGISKAIGPEIAETFGCLNYNDASTTTVGDLCFYPEGGSEINFNPDEFQTNTSTPKPKRREDSSQSSAENLEKNMDLSRSRRESGAAATAEGKGHSVSGSAGVSGYYESGTTKRSSSAATSSQVGSAEMVRSSARTSFPLRRYRRKCPRLQSRVKSGQNRFPEPGVKALFQIRVQLLSPLWHLQRRRKQKKRIRKE